MRQYAIRRILIAVFVLFLVSVLVAGIARLASESFYLGWPGTGASITEEEIEAIRALLGLDRPFLAYYGDWIAGAFSGDFGRSMRPGQPEVSGILAEAVPATIQLGVLALIVALLIAAPLGFWSALRPNSVGGRIVRVLSVGGLGVPSLVIGPLVVLLGAMWFSWVPRSTYLGDFPPSTYVGVFEDPLESLAVISAPAFVVSVGLAAVMLQMARSVMLRIVREDYIRTARSKGLSERVVLLRHVLGNVFVTMTPIVGGLLGFLFGGLIIVESLFDFPGLGNALVRAIVVG